MKAALGLWDGHGASVALVADGRLVFALAEERPTRVKRRSGFPTQALRACLDFAEREGHEIDALALAGRHGRAPLRLMQERYARGDPQRQPLSLASRMAMDWENRAGRVPGLRDLELRLGQRALRARLPPGLRLHSAPHHEAHAFSALLGLREPGALVLTADAYGEGVSASARLASAPLQPIQELGPSFGLALLYGATTVALGFQEGEEGKVMGLAARGQSRRGRARFASLFTREDGAPKLVGRLSRARLRQVLRGLSREDAAAGLQAFVEQEAVAWARGLLEQTGATRLLLAGGLFANVRLNQRLAESPGLRSLFVFPEMGDGGLSAGAAARLWWQRTRQLPEPLSRAALGCVFSQERLERAAADAGLRGVDAGPQQLAQRLAAGQVLCLYQGRDEFGPRALGQRSILFAPRHGLAARVNRALGRDPIMAFAPMLLESELSGALKAASVAELGWMTVTAEASEDFARRCPAAVHVDGSTRPQVPGDPALIRLLEAARDQGLGALINTSFNLHGEPIVHSPEDAVRSFTAAGLDGLVSGRRLFLPRDRLP